MDFNIIKNEIIGHTGCPKKVFDVCYYLNKWGNDIVLCTFRKKIDFVYNNLLKDINVVTLNKICKKLSKKIENRDMLNLQSIPIIWISNFMDIVLIWVFHLDDATHINDYYTI